MTTSVVVTKLFVPPLRPNAVPRPRLIARLNEGLYHKLTLISAPAGFGKTTVISEWIADCQRPTAWLSLDPEDNDPARFLTYLIAALQTIDTEIGKGALGALQSPQPPPTASILTALVNDISATPGQFILVLDDYHLIDVEPVDRALAFLLDHVPPNLHLVIATREDPPLPLVRLRARDQLTELRAADIRFAPVEAADFLRNVMGLRLSAAEITALEERTEGWIAGLQLAALSMQGHQDVSGFIRSFAGNHRYIVDYLVEEVLQRQPAHIHSFLLQTAVLDRLHGPLCDAVTGQENGSALLEALERANFFVVPLDDQRRWYRYHHLFVDVLRAHLAAEHPEQTAMLHLRASMWYERHDFAADAIRHALAAGDFARAADLIECALPALRRSRLGDTLFGWLRALPDELIRRRPVLSVAYAWALLAGGELDAVEERLRDAERWLDTTTGVGERLEALQADFAVANTEEFHRLPGSIAIYRAAHAQLVGNVPASESYAEQVLALVPENDHLPRGAAAAFLGLASWARGDLEVAHRNYAAGMASLQRAGHLSDVINGSTVLAEIRMAQGRLRDAERTLELAVKSAEELGNPSLHGTVDFLVRLSELRRERGDLHTATEHLLRAEELATGTGVAHDRSRWCAAMARIKEAQGDLNGALNLLDEAGSLAARDFLPNVRPVPALKARLWIAQGRLGEALSWARGHGLSPEDDLSYLREFEHITLARVLLATNQPDRSERSIHETMGLLDRLLQEAEATGRMGSVIEILTLQALAHHAHGDLSTALASLQRSLTLAEPEGFVRTFVDEGPPMVILLRAAATRGIASNYVRELLAILEEAEVNKPAKQGLIEPLSDRELDVLRLLGTDLSGPEIAYELVVSLNTMRTHSKNIYSKLGVNTRRTAVRRAQELGLL